MKPQTAAPSLVIWTVGEAGLAAELRGKLTEAIKGAHASLEFVVRHLTNVDDLPDEQVNVVIGAIATRTWSRSRHVSPKGPPPLRSADWPWGFPWLSPSHRAVVDDSNSQLKAVLHVLADTCFTHPSARVIFLHPEDLGGAELGRPASPWQLTVLRDLARQHGLLRYACYQCEFGPSPRPAPLGILSSEPLPTKLLARGWPFFRGDGEQDYLGPLTDRCNCHSPHDNNQDINDRLRAPRCILQPHFAKWLCTFLVREHLKISAAGRLRSGENGARSESDDGFDTDTDLDIESEATWNDSDVPFFEGAFADHDDFLKDADIGDDVREYNDMNSNANKAVIGKCYLNLQQNSGGWCSQRC